MRVHRLDVQRHQGAGLGTYLREYLVVPAPGRLGSGPAPPPPPLRARPGRIAAGLPGVRRAAAAARRRPGPPRPPRGDAGVLPDPLPDVSEPAGAPPAAPPGAPVDRVRDATSSPSTRRCATDSSASAWPPTSCRRHQQPIARAVRRRRRTRAAPSARTASLRLIYTGAPDADVRAGRHVPGRGPRRRRAARPRRPLRPVRPRRFRGRAPGAGRRARDRRSRDVPRPDPDRGCAGRRRRGRHRARADPARPVHRDDPVDEGLRVRGDGQAGRRVAAAARRAHLPRGHGRGLRAGRCRRDGRGDPRPRRRSARPGSGYRADAGRGPRRGMGTRGGAVRGDRRAARPIGLLGEESKPRRLRPAHTASPRRVGSKTVEGVAC